jgi:hypothetical protein
LVAAFAAAALGGVAAFGTAAGKSRSAQTCLVPGHRKTIDQLWKPDIAAAISYAHSRTGDIAFNVRTDHRYYGYRSNHVEWSASVLKAMMLVAYLDMPSVADRDLNGNDKALLYPMITRSDNNAADQVFTIVGPGRLQDLASRVGMHHFAPASPIWGESHITAADQTKFFLHIDSFIVRKHRGYAMYLLRSITPSQRWGIGELALPRWTLYFKGGWGSGTGLIDHQVVLLVRGCNRVALAVLTMNDGSHDYGKETLRQIFIRLLKGLPTKRA